MSIWIEQTPWLTALAVLVTVSAFFSGSEAALFSLTRQHRRSFSSGNQAQRIAAALLSDADRLLTAILFWNLVTNVAYFTIGSIVSLRLRDAGYGAESGLFALGSLLGIIFFGELVPKSLGVLHPRALAALVGVPLAVAVRAFDPLAGVFRVALELSRRVVWPGFKGEPYLDVGDLERAVQLSHGDAHLLEQEQLVLQNIVGLSETRADELMRPRVQFLVFQPPVALADLQGRMTPSGYLLVTEPNGDEVAAAVALKSMTEIPPGNLERYAEPVLYVPWSTPAASVLDQMHTSDRDVAAVVNEFGETIGLLTLDDILDTIFMPSPSRSERLMDHEPIQPAGAALWHVTGMTSRRQLQRYFRCELPESKSQTVGGILQEQLQRLPQAGDQCQWGPFEFRVLRLPRRGQLVVELARAAGTEPAP